MVRLTQSVKQVLTLHKLFLFEVDSFFCMNCYILFQKQSSHQSNTVTNVMLFFIDFSSFYIFLKILIFEFLSAKKTTPSKCITHSKAGVARPQICAGHGTCSKADTCTCETGWGSAWTNEAGAAADDANCEYKSCPDECSRQGRCIQSVCYCEPGFTGLNCKQVVCGEICSGAHQYPVQSNGKCSCECMVGWNGDGCNTKIISQCPDDCGEFGSCDKDKCICMSNWSGEFCEIPPCPTEVKGISCSGKGLCLESQECECQKGYTGNACELLNCESLNNCNGATHGLCNNGTCACLTGWGSQDCSQKIYPDCPMSCSNVGECNQGKCFCPPGYYGNGCQKTYNMCTPENCNDHGSCNITVCNCNHGWKGDSCEIEIKKCPNACSGELHGTCDTVTGECSCKDGFTGLGCADKACMNGCGHGSCNNGTCACDPSWEGPKCSIRTLKCFQV